MELRFWNRKRDFQFEDVEFQYIERKEWKAGESLPIPNLLARHEYRGEVDIPDSLAQEILKMGNQVSEAQDNFHKAARGLEEWVR